MKYSKFPVLYRTGLCEYFVHLTPLPSAYSSFLGRDKYFGFAVDWFIVLISVGSCFVMFTTVGSLYSGLCFYITGMVVDMKTQLSCSVFGSHETSNRTKCWTIYVKEITVHIEILEYDLLFLKSSQIQNKALPQLTIIFFSLADSLYHLMELISFTTILTCTLIIALNLFAIDLTDTISIEAMNAFLNLLLVLLLTFMYCYLSECLTSDLLEIGDIFYNSEWYQLDVKNQRVLTLPIGRAQRVFRLRGVGLFDCSLSVFSKVTDFFSIALQVDDSCFAFFFYEYRLFALLALILLFFTRSKHRKLNFFISRLKNAL